MTEYLLTAAIFIFAGLIQSVSGFGSLLFAMPLLTLYLAPQVCVPLGSLCGLFVTMVMGLGLIRHMERKKIVPIIVGSLPGVVVGVFLLKSVDPGVFRLILGSMLTGFALFSLLARPRPRNLHWGIGTASGGLAGALAAAFSAGGPPVIVYIAMQDWTPTQKRATITGFYLMAGPFISLGHAMVGLTTGHVLLLTAAAMPSIYLGVKAGFYITKRITPGMYMKIVQFLLLAMGVMLLIR